MTIPSFSRLEITHGSGAALPDIANELRSLAHEMDTIADRGLDDLAATLLAHNAIREASKKLRKETK